MNHANLIQILSKTGIQPTYLECFDGDKVHLIFAKRPSLGSESDVVFSDFIKEENIHEESIEKCDLTGDPLQVDLGGNDSIQIVKMENTDHRWTLDELKHFPLPVRDARREINKIFKKSKPVEKDSLSTYIVCNANDSKKTVLLGGNNRDIMSCSIHVVGILPQHEVEKTMKEMVDDHLKNCCNTNQVKYSVKMRYNLYGSSFRNISCQNASMRQLSTSGNIYVDIVSPKKVFKLSQTEEGSMKMHLEVVAGHTQLGLNFLWSDLVQLQALIDILSDSDLNACDETIICKNAFDPDAILQTIAELVSSKFLKQEREKDVVDLNNLRQDDFLDALWNVLIRCENLSVLRDSFNFLFEELAEGSLRILPIKDDCSKVSTIIKGILQGKIGLSTISLLESIELLFELGAQKLKFDFQVILTQFVPHIKNTINSVWKDFYHKGQEEMKKSRRTRATRVTSHLGVQNLTLRISQLAYLTQLYIGSEFIYLLKDQVNLTEDGFRSFCRCIEKEYVSDRNRIADFNETYQNPLNKMSFDLDLKNASIVESIFPSRWTMSMVTGRQTTIYDLSDSPIFPTIIYQYDVPISTTENLLYYVSKMSRSTGLV